MTEDARAAAQRIVREVLASHGTSVDATEPVDAPAPGVDGASANGQAAPDGAGAPPWPGDRLGLPDAFDEDPARAAARRIVAEVLEAHAAERRDVDVEVATVGEGTGPSPQRTAPLQPSSTGATAGLRPAAVPADGDGPIAAEPDATDAATIARRIVASVLAEEATAVADELSALPPPLATALAERPETTIRLLPEDAVDGPAAGADGDVEAAEPDEPAAEPDEPAAEDGEEAEIVELDEPAAEDVAVVEPAEPVVETDEDDEAADPAPPEVVDPVEPVVAADGAVEVADPAPPEVVEPAEPVVEADGASVAIDDATAEVPLGEVPALAPVGADADPTRTAPQPTVERAQPVTGDEPTTVVEPVPDGPAGTTRWVLASVLGAVSLAVLLPMAVAALRRLVALG